jgi:hypothetical protein
MTCTEMLTYRRAGPGYIGIRGALTEAEARATAARLRAELSSLPA